MKMEKHIISGWAGRLKQFFCRQEKLCVAIVPAENGECSLLCYKREENGWYLAEEGVSLVANRFCADGTAEDGTLLSGLENLADWAAMELAKRGWQEAGLIYVLPEQELIGYAISLPPNLTPAQQAEAAYWELDDKLAAKGLSAEAFACLCEPLGQETAENQCMILGVRQAYLQEVQAAFSAADLPLTDIIAGGGEQDVQSRLAGYLSQAGKTHGFCKRQAVELDWPRIAVCWLGLLASILLIWVTMDIYAYEQAKTAAETQRTELLRLAPERQEMLAVEKECRQIEAREALMQELQGKGPQWYSVLVHLGANTKEGVFITSMVSDDDGRSLKLEGQAVSYDALAEFVDGLEQDRDFFPQGIRLQDSETMGRSQENKGMVKFSLTIDWESQINDEKAAGKVENIS